MCRLIFTFTWMLFVFIMFKSTRAGLYARNERSIISSDKEETGIRIAQLTREINMNPKELGYLVGDIMVIKNKERNALKDEYNHWPDNIINYYISGNFSEKQLNLIQNAIKALETNTCLSFNQMTEKEDYINITNVDDGCWSNLGRIGGQQIVNLRASCLTEIGSVIHLLLHAAGFLHEHNRPDRDKYVDINWENIQSVALGGFIKAAPDLVDTFGLSYDYDSVMHYPSYAFAIDNRTKTIIPKNPPNAQIGQRQGLSKLDVKKINTLYPCKKSG